MSEGKPPGLRERKRAAARARVEEIALDLCLRHGYESVTVAQICATAEIAQSTFFNYFGSKDEAILGRPPRPTSRAIEGFIAADGPLLGDLLLLITGARDAVGSLELFGRRVELIDGSPQLRARMLGRAEADSWQTDAVERRLRRGTRLAAPAIAECAQLATALAMSILRHAVGSSQATPGDEWDDRLRHSLALAQNLLTGESSAPGPARTAPRRVPGKERAGSLWTSRAALG
jgi:AcrR family transcriptional regulator